MDSIQNRIIAFAKLGAFLGQFSIDKIKKIDNIEHNEIFFDGFLHQIKLAQEKNSWFTKDNVLFSLNSLHKSLTENNLNKFTESLDSTIKPSKKISLCSILSIFFILSTEN